MVGMQSLAPSGLIRATVFTLICAAPFAARPAAYSCVGKVDQVAVTPGGPINASFSFSTGKMEWQVICSIDSSINDVTTASCKGILAVLMTARASGQSVEMWFDNATGGSCSAAPVAKHSHLGLVLGTESSALSERRL